MIAIFTSRNHFTPNHILGLTFYAWCALTILWSPNLPDALGSLILLTIGAAAFALGARLHTLRQIVIGTALGLTISSLIVWTPLKEIIPHQYVLIDTEGLFGNHNMLAEAAAVVIVGCIGYRLWWLIPGVVPALYHPPYWSRGAYVAIAAALLTFLWSRSRRLTILLGLLSICAAVTLTMLRFGSVSQRLQIYQDTLSGLSLFGHGLGSFRHLFPYLTSHFDGTIEVVDHPHNEALEIWFETGAIGLFVFAAWIATAIRSADDVTRGIIVCWLMVGMFAFPSHIPFTLFMAALALGHSVHGGADIRDLCYNFRLRIQARNGYQAAAERAHRALEAGSNA